MTYRDLLRIIELIKSSSQFGEFHLKVGDIEVHLHRHGVAHRPASTAPALPAAVASAAVPTPPAHASPVESCMHQRHGHVGASACVTEAAVRGAPLVYSESAILIRSPMVGTFYRAPEPGAKPFVEVDQLVEPDTIVCIIEVMKLMHSMPARHQAVVTHILMEDAEPVEYGQILDFISIKDPTGLLTPERARTLFPAVVKVGNGTPRAIQFSSAIPIRCKAALGWAAKRRQAVAMLV